MANPNPDVTKQLDLAIALLGREPRVPFSVKTCCPDGSPQVLVADPVFVEEGIWKPFPAFLWLVCPRLKSLTSDLEQQGLIKKFSHQLSSDAEFAERFQQGQQHIAKIRLAAAEKIYPGQLPEQIKKILTSTTIAGSHDFTGVKCLHSHLAQELAFNNNPIGAAVLALIKPCSSHDQCSALSIKRSEA